MTKEEIFDQLKNILVAEFELEEDTVKLESLLADDLDLDSIDAIDLIVKMKAFTPEGKPSIDASIFKGVKTVQEVLGHENLNTTQIYTHIENTELKIAAEANPLSKLDFGKN